MYASALSLACAPQQQLDELPMMVNGVFHGTVNEQYEATQRFRKLLSIGEGGWGTHRHLQVPEALAALLVTPLT